MRRLKIDPWIVVSLVLGVALIGSLVANTRGVKLFRSRIVATKLVSASEIYPMFICPCCGKPLDKNNICCEMARERIGFIDSEVAGGKEEKEIILVYVKKYGLTSFADKNKAQEFKDELAKTAPLNRPIIVIAPTTYDFGEVSQKKGKVTTLFDLKNEGGSDLVINKLDTSCGCTSASIVLKGQEGPLFAMAGHGTQNPTDWSLTIPPGETAQLKVYYDPDVHKDFRGPATREVSIFSNDPIDFEKKVTVELNQVD